MREQPEGLRLLQIAATALRSIVDVSLGRPPAHIVNRVMGGA